MRRNPDDLQRLIAELQDDARQLEQLCATNGRAMERIAAGANDYLDYAALGYTIHNIYAVMENGCLRVAKLFENNLADPSWHRDLLDRMKLTIEGVRPAFLDEETYLLLDQLRAFRGWRMPDRILELARLAVMTRPGEEIADTDVPYERVDVTCVDLSSTRIRKRLEAGLSIRYLVPEPARERTERAWMDRAAAASAVGGDRTKEDRSTC